VGLRDKSGRTEKKPQGILPFEYEVAGEPEDVTPRAGLPLVLETARPTASGAKRRERSGHR
jgi:hypothetical protein